MQQKKAKKMTRLVHSETLARRGFQGLQCDETMMECGWKQDSFEKQKIKISK
jgi:hypothetical protein